MSLRNRLTALFSPHRRWLAPEAGRLQAGGLFGPNEAVVPRVACTHFRLPLPAALTAGGRAAALDLAVRRVAPSPSPRYAAVWQGEVAQVWVLDERAAADAGEAEQLIAESSLLPESALPDGARLLAVAKGVEGQVWRAGQLVASRCWPEPPSPEAWSRFLRAAAMPVAAGPPAVETLPAAAKPWGQAPRRWRWAPAQLESAFWRASALLLGLLLGWPLIASILWGSASVWQAQRLAELRTASAPLIAAREQAEQAQLRLAALARLGAGPVDAALLADLRERLPAEDRLAGWLRDGTRLRIELQTTSTDPRRYVQALAGHPLLSGVVAQPTETGRMQLEIELPDLEQGP